ncbi:MAG: hypothetical protein ACOZQL_03755 [Myxococcota bacterium]
MKKLTVTLPLTLALGGLVAALVPVLPLDAAGQTSWLVGCLVSAVLGVLALVVKTLLAPSGLTGAAALKGLLAGQGLAFLLRLIAVGVGAVAMKQSDLSPFAFVISFFVVSLAQQVVETRTLLAANNPVKSSEVTP